MYRIVLVMTFLMGPAGCSKVLELGDVRLGDGGMLDGPAPVKLSDPGSYTISTSTAKTNADGLASALGSGRKRTVDEIIDKANRPITQLCELDAGEALYPLASGGTGEYGFCWSMNDPDNTDWIPQGITTTGDAFTARSYASREAVVITWHNATETSTRISIAPAGGYSLNLNYRHLLLVTPQTGATFSAVNCHAGGAMWYGDLLYVACTNSIKIFDWRYVYSADFDAFCDNKVGKFLDGTVNRYCADLAAYLMMQVGEITSPSGKVRFSSISFDRASTPDKLVVSEYSTSALESCSGSIWTSRPVCPAIPPPPTPMRCPSHRSRARPAEATSSGLTATEASSRAARRWPTGTGSCGSGTRPRGAS